MTPEGVMQGSGRLRPTGYQSLGNLSNPLFQTLVTEAEREAGPCPRPQCPSNFPAERAPDLDCGSPREQALRSWAFSGSGSEVLGAFSLPGRSPG